LEASGLTNEIDARPSDAIALAVRTYAPIYVSESVMEIAAFVPSDESETETTEFNIANPDTDKKPLTKEAQLAAMQDKLREALEKEEYERAAKLRDEIKRLTQNN
jgi:bifunctional DNase/RNase